MAPIERKGKICLLHTIFQLLMEILITLSLSGFVQMICQASFLSLEIVVCRCLVMAGTAPLSALRKFQLASHALWSSVTTQTSPNLTMGLLPNLCLKMYAPACTTASTRCPCSCTIVTALTLKTNRTHIPLQSWWPALQCHWYTQGARSWTTDPLHLWVSCWKPGRIAEHRSKYHNFSS